MKEKNKLIFLMSIFVIFSSLSIIDVSAKELNTNDETNKIILQDNSKETVEDILDGSLKSTSLPTSSLNLATQSYKATVTRATSRWLYTNVYFNYQQKKNISLNILFLLLYFYLFRFLIL